MDRDKVATRQPEARMRLLKDVADKAVHCQ
jgi:hypothetical protein